MAERLKRYRPLGVSIPTVPTVDYVATGRAQARAMAPIQRGLDSMTNFALKQFEQKALIEGAEYGAENAPTKQQLQDAQGDIEDLVPGDQTTVFGRAARKAALQSMTTNFEVSAREQMINLQVQAELQDMDTATFTEQSNAIIDGYTSTLQDVSPSAALTFRATMATVGNSALLAHSKDQIKKQQEAEEFAHMSAMDIMVNGDATRGIPSSVATIISEGSTTTYDAFGDMQHVSVREKIDTVRNNLKELGFSVRDKAGAEKYLKTFDAKVAEAMNAEVANFVLANPLKNLKALKSGDIKDPKMQDLWVGNMDEVQKSNAISAAYSALSEEQQRENALEAQREKDLEKQADKAYVNIVDALQSGDEQARDAALSVLRISDPSKYEEFSKRIQTGDVNDDARTVVILEQQLADRQLRSSFVTSEYLAGNIGLTTFKTYMNAASALTDKRYQAAGTRAKFLLGLPDTPLINPRGSERKAQQKVAAIMVELQAKQFDPTTPEDFDPLAFVEEKASKLLAEMDKATDKEIANATKQMPKIAEALGLDKNAPYSDIATAFANTSNPVIRDTYEDTMDILAEAN